MAITPQKENRARRQIELPEEKQFDERTLHIDRVARVVRGGRRFRFRALVAVGDRKNRVGVGSAKGADVTSAVTKATDVAKKHMVSVAIYKGTIPHEAEAKVSGAHILLKPASPGTGLIAGGVVRTVLEIAGINNALSKSLGSSNKTNLAYATIDALQKIEPSKNWIIKPASVHKPHHNKSDVSKEVTDSKAKAEQQIKSSEKPDEKNRKSPGKKPTEKISDKARRNHEN
jgi:small subunit ribosomal protein S5